MPEQFGSDFLMMTPLGLVGVQRKELSDLVTSHNDDRISRDLIAMKELDIAVWLIEGTTQWTSDGQAMWTRTNYTMARHLGFLFSLALQGFWILSTSTVNESGSLLLALEKWLTKEKHSGIAGRPPPRGVFGTPDVREWQAHFLSGLPGISTTRAQAIRDHYGGLPLRLTENLSDVPGIGKKTADRIAAIFNLPVDC